MSYEEEEDQLGGIRGVDDLASRGVGASGFSIVTELHVSEPHEKLPPTRRGGVKATQITDDEINSPTYKPPLLPQFDCEKCDVTATYYCDTCGSNFCDTCDANIHDPMSQEEIEQHYREPLSTRLAAMAAELAPYVRPPPSQTASQTPSATGSQAASGISVGGLYDLITSPPGEAGPTRSELAYQEACQMAAVRQQFRAVCDQSHPEAAEAKEGTEQPYATIYCDTCGLNFCSACDTAEHGADGGDHDRFPLEYKPEAPLPRSMRNPDAPQEMDPDEAERRAAIAAMSNYVFSPTPMSPNDAKRYGSNLTLGDAGDATGGRSRRKVDLDKLPPEVRSLLLRQRAAKADPRSLVRAQEVYKKIEQERVEALQKARSRDDSDTF